MITLDKCEEGFRILLKNGEVYSISDNIKKYKKGNTIIFTSQVLSDSDNYVIKNKDILYQKNGIVLKIIDSNKDSKEHTVRNLETNEQYIVSDYFVRNGYVTDSLELYFKTRIDSYLVNEEIITVTGDKVKILGVFPNDLSVAFGDYRCERLVDKNSLLYEGIINPPLKGLRLGKTIYQNTSKMYATCIKMMGSENIVVMFENGNKRTTSIDRFYAGEVKHRSRKEAPRGGICHVRDRSFYEELNDRVGIGRVFTNKYGMSAKLLKRIDITRCLCCYEDGYIFTSTFLDLENGTFNRHKYVSELVFRRTKVKSINYNTVCGEYVLEFENGCTEIASKKPDLSKYTAKRLGMWLNYYYDIRLKKYVVVYRVEDGKRIGLAETIDRRG